ncbi:probable cation-transporting ATPase 13A5 [Eublepharis macularius]|uniref:Probable cation-transporting ATPase 13A5 n=1 Tax=Eublepharis macularius TaxID=481883 RepID=A0AA97JK96_EUBMA|nr:probable cation-transporting ATPase 13A5 [Eublepharis macularius]
MALRRPPWEGCFSGLILAEVQCCPRLTVPVPGKKQSVSDIVAVALIFLTIPVPPALPSALTTGIIYAQRRLKKRRIFCISPQRINICGQLNLVCFDKTGTLTEDGLDLWGTIPCQGGSFQNVHSFSSGSPLPWGPLCIAMATCHSLLVLEGKIQGDPLDLKTFEGTGWVSPLTWQLYRQKKSVDPEGKELQARAVSLPSLSALLASGVGRGVGGNFFLFPSTVPRNFVKELKVYTSQGFRVIALAQKALAMGEGADLDGLEREEVESGLTFLGLLIMENRLKSETKPVLEELMGARIRSVMVTGDNLQTAVTLAKNSGMVSSSSRVILVEASEPEGSIPASISWQLVEDMHQHSGEKKDLGISIEDTAVPREFHFALNGKSYQVLMKHFSGLVPKVLLNGTVFARMSPGQKSSLVEEFQKLE